MTTSILNPSTQQALVARLGETDQAYLEQNTAELALVRGQVRLELAKLSKHKQEQHYFLNQAIAILELARIEFEEIELALYLKLSIVLAKCYMLHYDISHETRYALIVETILKPLAHHDDSEVYELLIKASQAQNKPALATHWQQKMQRVQGLSALKH